MRINSGLSRFDVESAHSIRVPSANYSRQETPLRLSSVHSNINDMSSSHNYLQVPQKKIPYKQAMGALKKSLMNQENSRQQEL